MLSAKWGVFRLGLNVLTRMMETDRHVSGDKNSSAKGKKWQ